MNRTIEIIAEITTPSAAWTIQRVTFADPADEAANTEPVGVRKDGEFVEAFGGSFPEYAAREYIAKQLSVEDIAAAFEAAREAVKAVPYHGNTGTCNFDCPEVKIPARLGRRFQKAAALAGVELTTNSGRYSKGWAWVHGVGVGTQQGLQQTVEAEAARKALQEHGLHASVHYAVD